MDVLTHSLANTLKRFSGIAVTAYATGEEFSAARFLALLLTAIGFPVHVMAKHKPHTRVTCKSYGLASVIQAVLLLLFLIRTCNEFAFLEDFMQKMTISKAIFSMGDVNSLRATSNFVSAFMKPQPVPIPGEGNSEERKSPHEVSSNFVISQAGRYISTTDMYHSEQEALTFPDTNCGNMVWQYGGFIKLVDLTKSETCNDTHVNCNKVNPSMKNRRMVHYRPAANGFNRKMNVTFHDAFTRLGYEGDVVLYIGIGMQYSFKDDESKNDMFHGQKIENTVNTFRFTPQALKFLKRMDDLQMPMFMRGDFTLQVSRLAGYQYGLSTGCPSLFINEELHLGALLEEKYRRIMNRSGKKSLKIAFNLTGRYRLFGWMKLIADQHPGSLFYAQGPEDFRVLRNHNVSFDKVRFYGNIPDWLESLSHMDLSIGPRIHGNMAAIAAGVPAFVVAPDFRVVEMAERMKVPHTTMYDETLKNGMNVSEMISKVGFDGHMFDTNRCQIAKLYKEHLGKFGIQLARHVEKVSQIC
ncbi:Polysaccharide pyruvyl transferase [Gracilaria domingensis]|nr:Polysaccharide pyruvyl transferase [Gracilaria domingensis]